MSRGWLSVCLESARVARASLVVSGLVFILALTVPAATLMLAGRNMETEASLLARVDDAGTRVITILSVNSGAVTSGAVGRIARLDGVAWVMGLGPSTDVHLPGSGRIAPVRTMISARAPVKLSTPRPRADPSAADAPSDAPASSPTRAYLSKESAARLGLGGAYGRLQPGALDVVGWFEAGYPLGDLNAFVIVPAEGDGIVLDRIILSVRDSSWVDSVAAALPAMLGESARTNATIQTSQALLAAREAVGGEAAHRDRELIVALLLAEMALGCLVVFAGTMNARRDFGRRRALGASRGQLVSLVVMSTLWPAILGALVGVVAGSAYLGSTIGTVPAWRFPCSIAVLTVMGLGASALLPAAVAATRDPLRVLRVP